MQPKSRDKMVTATRLFGIVAKCAFRNLYTEEYSTILIYNHFVQYRH